MDVEFPAPACNLLQVAKASVHIGTSFSRGLLTFGLGNRKCRGERKRASNVDRVLHHLLFYCLAGLGYEMVWTRLFAVGLGHEMPNVLAVAESSTELMNKDIVLFARLHGRSGITHVP
jgi:hypothetical protein